jgi:hypothetical protein
MLNVDVKKSGESGQNVAEIGDEELRRSHSNYGKKLVLPPIKRVNTINLNMSADNIPLTEENQNVDPYGPKM